MKCILSSIVAILILASFYFLYYAVKNNVINNPGDLYKAVSSYSGLFTFTLAFCAFYATLLQVEIFQENNSSVIKQIQKNQEQYEANKLSSEKSETLKYCRIYFEELQNEIKDLMGSSFIYGTPLNWVHLILCTNEELRLKYKKYFDDFTELDRGVKNNGLIVLYKLESFSAIILRGNLDIDLAKGLIGKTYVRQIGAILGLVAFYRSSDFDDFGSNMLELFRRWGPDFEIDTL